MVDQALPKSDRIDLPDDEELIEVASTLQRIQQRETTDKAKSKSSSPHQNEKVVIRFVRADWERLIRAMPATSALSKRVLDAIRTRLQGSLDETILVEGSADGWSQFSTELFNANVCGNLSYELTVQVSRQIHRKK